MRGCTSGRYADCGLAAVCNFIEAHLCYVQRSQIDLQLIHLPGSCTVVLRHWQRGNGQARSGVNSHTGNCVLGSVMRFARRWRCHCAAGPLFPSSVSKLGCTGTCIIRPVETGLEQHCPPQLSCLWEPLSCCRWMDVVRCPKQVQRPFKAPYYMYVEMFCFVLHLSKKLWFGT